MALSPHHLRKFGLPENLVAGGVAIITSKPVVSVINLGAHFDIHVGMQHHVDAVCKCNCHLRHIKSIRPYIMKHVCHSLVIAVVVSNLDCCSALLLVLPYHLTRLQKIHNRAVCMVVLRPISAHITPVLVDLHWLPIGQCITFKVLVYIYIRLCMISHLPIFLNC